MKPDRRKEEVALLNNIHENLPSLTQLFDACSDHWGYYDPVYRFYHKSYKVYALQEVTKTIVAKLLSLAPGRELSVWFETIIREGTGKTFVPEHNEKWLLHTRPIVEAFFHARYFLEMAVKCGEELRSPPEPMPSNWAALLSLYGLR